VSNPRYSSQYSSPRAPLELSGWRTGWSRYSYQGSRQRGSSEAI
jgi:hypothetical protein